MDKVDVVIVGAGPSGSSAAYFLTKLGVEVALIDKSTFPRDKTCGDGVGPRSIEMLVKMGLRGWLESGEFHRCNGGRLFASDGSYFQAQVPVEDSPYPYFYVVPRLTLDEKLFRLAEAAGAKVFTGCKATSLNVENGKVTGVTVVHSGEEDVIPCRAVICADGTSGTFAKCTGMHCVKPHAFAVRAYYSNVKGPDDCINVLIDKEIPEGYAWIFPMGQGRANIGLGISRTMLQSRNIDAKQLLEWFVRERDAGPIDLSEAVADTPVKGAFLRMGYGRHEILADGIMLAGDAAALVSPLSGEGIAYALESGEQAASTLKIALDNGDISARALKPYHNFLAKNFFSEHRQGEFIRQTLAFGNYALMDWMLNKGIKHPKLADKFMSVMMSTARPSALLNPKMFRYYLT